MKKKSIIWIIGIVFVVAAGLVTTLILYMTADLNMNQTIIIPSVSIDSLPDGTYAGEYGTGRWQNELEIKLDSGRITEIKANRTVRFERPEVTSELFERVIASQRIDVDCVSGATATSNVYLKSIENALQAAGGK